MKSSLFEFNWTIFDNLLEQFLHIPTNSFATLFSSENIPRETVIFKKCNFFGQVLVFFTQEARSLRVTLIFLSLDLMLFSI